MQSSSNVSHVGQSESSYVENTNDGIASNYKPNKLKPAMMTLSGHSCVKSPANLAPLPIHSKKSNQFKTQKDAEYLATDDFAEFEDFEDFEEHGDHNEDNTIIHTPPSNITDNNNNYQQQQQQQQYNINNCYYGGGGGGYNNNSNDTQQFYHHSQYQPNPNQYTTNNPLVFYTNKFNQNQSQNQNQNQTQNAYHNYALQQQYNYVALQQHQKQQQQQQPPPPQPQQPQTQTQPQPQPQPQQQSPEYKQESNILKEKLLEAQLCHQEKVERGSIHFPASDLCGRYEFIRYLGHGSYGHVCEARSLLSRHKHEAVAIKKVPHVFRNITDAKRLLRELVILRTVKQHEAIITLIDILPPNDIQNFDTLYLVFEFVDTDLSQLINSPQNFEKLHAQYIIYQILLGLQYLHSANICHRDLKPANILVNENVSTKICDFGLARGISENCIAQKPKPKSHSKLQIKKEFKVKKGEKSNKIGRQLTKHVVTRWYRAPEVILFSQRREYLTAIDMWSVGCILSELLMMIGDNGNFKQRQPLFPGRSCFPLSARDPEAYKDNLDQLNCIFKVIGTPSPDEIEKIKDKQARAYLEKLAKNSFQKPLDLNLKFQHASKQELDLLRRLLQFDVEKRITVDQALSHPYLEDVRDLQAELRHKKVIFEFEDVALDIKTIYELIVDEICQYNANLLSESD